MDLCGGQSWLGRFVRPIGVPSLCAQTQRSESGLEELKLLVASCCFGTIAKASEALRETHHFSVLTARYPYELSKATGIPHECNPASTFRRSRIRHRGVVGVQKSQAFECVRPRKPTLLDDHSRLVSPRKALTAKTSSWLPGTERSSQLLARAAQLQPSLRSSFRSTCFRTSRLPGGIMYRCDTVIFVHSHDYGNGTATRTVGDGPGTRQLVCSKPRKVQLRIANCIFIHCRLKSLEFFDSAASAAPPARSTSPCWALMAAFQTKVVPIQLPPPHTLNFSNQSSKLIDGPWCLKWLAGPTLALSSPDSAHPCPPRSLRGLPPLDLDGQVEASSIRKRPAQDDLHPRRNF